ncbi:MAG TPA: ABC transporter permease, partial [Vicinamibacterales bacterium]|nr:ABC transporter permease [Vicinamibacterales bacterium]
LLDRIKAVPGVTEAATNRCTPYDATCARTLIFFPEHPTRASDAPVVGRHYVSSAYFHALGIPIRKGRALQDDDRAGRPPVAVVNETAARRFWPGDNPIGKKVWFSSAFTSPDTPVEIVGVVADVKYWPLNEPVGPDVYTSYLQYAYPSSMYLVKASTAASVIPAIRRAVAEVDPTLALSDVHLLDERVSAAVARPRFTASATAIFAIAAAMLAAMGVFGVMAYSVSLRREELALRLALGATPRGLQVHVLLHAARLAVGGSAAGGLAAVWLLRSLGSALYGVSSSDPVVLTIAAVSMGAVALAAAAAPAWRASRTDPLIALRRS